LPLSNRDGHPFAANHLHPKRRLGFDNVKKGHSQSFAEMERGSKRQKNAANCWQRPAALTPAWRVSNRLLLFLGRAAAGCRSLPLALCADISPANPLHIF